MSRKASSTPFGFKAHLYDRLRDAEQAMEDFTKAGKKSSLRVWGKRWKVYFEK